jgi:hypothetical protein
MVGNPTFLLNQMGDTVGGPQTGFIAKNLRTAFESLLDLAEILHAQPWFAASTARLLQPGTAVLAQLGRPLTYRLPVRSHSSGHFRLAVPLLQQPRGLHPPPLQGREISTNSRRISHAHSLAGNSRNVTILFNAQ